MHVRAVGVGKDAPTDGVEVRLLCDVEVAVLSVLERAVVYPDVLSTTSGRYQVCTTHVDGARTHECQVADNDVPTATEREDACIAVALAVVARHFDNDFASVIFCFFINAFSIRQRATTATGAHAGHTSSVQRRLNLVSNKPLGAYAGIVDTENGLVGCCDADVARHDEVAVSTIEDDDGILLDGILNGAFHVLPVRL